MRVELLGPGGAAFLGGRGGLVGARRRRWGDGGTPGVDCCGARALGVRDVVGGDHLGWERTLAVRRRGVVSVRATPDRAAPRRRPRSRCLELKLRLGASAFNLSVEVYTLIAAFARGYGLYSRSRSRAARRTPPRSTQTAACGAGAATPAASAASFRRAATTTGTWRAQAGRLFVCCCWDPSDLSLSRGVARSSLAAHSRPLARPERGGLFFFFFACFFFRRLGRRRCSPRVSRVPSRSRAARTSRPSPAPPEACAASARTTRCSSARVAASSKCAPTTTDNRPFRPSYARRRTRVPTDNESDVRTLVVMTTQRPTVSGCGAQVAGPRGRSTRAPSASRRHGGRPVRASSPQPARTRNSRGSSASRRAPRSRASRPATSTSSPSSAAASSRWARTRADSAALPSRVLAHGSQLVRTPPS